MTTLQTSSTASKGMNRVVLTVQSAHNLRDTAWIGKADPYVEVTVADAVISTHHVPGAGDQATFDESFAFNNVMPDDVIEFHVYDKNRMRPDSHMGNGSLALRKLFDAGRMETRVPLSTRSGTKDAGELWVTLRTERGGAGAGACAGSEKCAGTEGTGMESNSAFAETGRTAGSTEGATRAGAVLGQEYFTTTEDRPMVKERVEQIREHRPVEKEFVVETRATGQERETGRTLEHLGTHEHIISEGEPQGQGYYSSQTKSEGRYTS